MTARNQCSTPNSSSEHERHLRQLAQRLYEVTEHLDPGADEAIDWDTLTERRREFYINCVESLCAERDLISQILADDCMVAGQSREREQRYRDEQQSCAFDLAAGKSV